jgi:hypothetical protein
MASSIFNASLLILALIWVTSLVASDVTNVEEFVIALEQNKAVKYSIGYLSEANADVVNRYLMHNTERRIFRDRPELLNAIDNDTIIGESTGSMNDCTS